MSKIRSDEVANQPRCVLVWWTANAGTSLRNTFLRMLWVLIGTDASLVHTIQLIQRDRDTILKDVVAFAKDASSCAPFQRLDSQGSGAVY
jgi:hypothetical protein